MPVVIDTEDHPEAERVERYRETVLCQPLPVEVLPDPDGFSGRLEATQFGAVSIARLTQRTKGVTNVRRTRTLIRRCDPEAFRLMLNLRGHNVMSQGDREVTLGTGDMALFDSSRPFWVALTPQAGVHQDWAMLTFPQRVLSLDAADLRALTSRILATRSNALASLVSSFVVQLTRTRDEYEAADAARLSTVLTDLVEAVLAAELRATTDLPQATRRRGLMMQIQGFIVEHLDDPDLTPSTVAAAHHMSTRALHALFHQHQLSVAVWIRHRRLERCRQELADPRLYDRPVHAIGARWGFGNGAHFSRSFRAAYGMAPQEYRRSIMPPARP